ncbi:allophanate hydrolase-related protein [Pseudomonas sp. Hz4]
MKRDGWQLADGRWESGFICEAYGLEGATNISHLGGWRAYLRSRT